MDFLNILDECFHSKAIKNSMQSSYYSFFNDHS
jgi:hypothetical protein